MTSPLLIEEKNLSHAWVRVLEYICRNSGKEICPLVLSITNFEEDINIRRILNDSLTSNNLAPIQTISETIFPKSLYLYCKKDRNAFYKEYLNNLPRLKKIDTSNKKGTYFSRLIDYNNGTSESEKVNQLEIIIQSLNGSIKRRSKLQASIFNPNVDHTNSVFQGFPCLQHITFYKTEDNGLIMNGFYAIQYLYRRAYGNWLGLINMGKFIAEEAGLNFERLNCYIGVEHLDNLSKSDANRLLDEISNIK